MSVQTKIENYLNYITGSGGWPSNTNIGVIGGVDYIIESGSDDIYFHEMNTLVEFMVHTHTNVSIQQNV